ncbi:MAG: AhpC/TSA family protein [Granulosicoccus sp.]|nr:AhpC/TSA family protein [Granulosicoccus sp.]
MLMPRQSVPSLNLPTLSGADFSLVDENPEHFSLLVFYRGLHCPVCQKYLSELVRLQDDFAAKGVSILVLSTDDKERSLDMMKKTKGDSLSWGYDLPLSVARDWGLYISTSRGKTSIGIEEPDLFAEPGVFLIRPDNTLYYGAVQTMPFARPLFSDLLAAVNFAIEKDYPARGEYTGEV